MICVQLSPSVRKREISNTDIILQDLRSYCMPPNYDEPNTRLVQELIPTNRIHTFLTLPTIFTAIIPFSHLALRSLEFFAFRIR